jgi:putative ABC transport system ATP-binding protein
MVTHDPVAAAHADRVVLLADGRVVDEIGGEMLTAEFIGRRTAGSEQSC